VPLYGLNKLIFAKLTKFKGHYFEMRLVSFLLRRATGLQKLLLLVPPVLCVRGITWKHLNNPWIHPVF
jgi:hypothetical protein